MCTLSPNYRKWVLSDPSESHLKRWHSSTDIRCQFGLCFTYTLNSYCPNIISITLLLTLLFSLFEGIQIFTCFFIAVSLKVGVWVLAYVVALIRRQKLLRGWWHGVPSLYNQTGQRVGLRQSVREYRNKSPHCSKFLDFLFDWIWVWWGRPYKAVTKCTVRVCFISMVALSVQQQNT